MKPTERISDHTMLPTTWLISTRGLNTSKKLTLKYLYRPIGLLCAIRASVNDSVQSRCRLNVTVSLYCNVSSAITGRPHSAKQQHNQPVLDYNSKYLTFDYCGICYICRLFDCRCSHAPPPPPSHHGPHCPPPHLTFEIVMEKNHCDDIL